VPTGTHLTMPSVRYQRVAAGDTWERLAQLHLGDARPRGVPRAHQRRALRPLALDGHGDPAAVPPAVRRDERGAPLRDRAALLRRPAMVQFITEFNHLPSQRVSRGQVLVLPLADVVLRETSRRGPDAALVAAHAAQRDVEREFPTLQQLVQRGLYVEAVALGARLAAVPEVTSPPQRGWCSAARRGLRRPRPPRPRRRRRTVSASPPTRPSPSTPTPRRRSSSRPSPWPAARPRPWCSSPRRRRHAHCRHGALINAVITSRRSCVRFARYRCARIRNASLEGRLASSGRLGSRGRMVDWCGTPDRQSDGRSSVTPHALRTLLGQHALIQSCPSASSGFSGASTI
jgi:hypothetical protein